MTKRKESDLSLQRVEILKKFINHYSWTPQWKAEVTLAVEGLEHRLTIAERFAGSTALRSQLSDAHKYRGEALLDVSALRRAETTQNNFQPINPEVFRKDESVERAMAKYFLFSQSLLEDKWPVHTEPRFSRLLRPYVRIVRNKEPEELVGDWYSAYASSSDRHLHWLMHTRDAWLNPKVQGSLFSETGPPVASTA